MLVFDHAKEGANALSARLAEQVANLSNDGPRRDKQTCERLRKLDGPAVIGVPGVE